MQDLLADLLAETASIVVYTVLATALSVLGLFAERASFATYGSGDLQLALWYGFVGVVLLVGAGMLVRDRLVPGLRSALA